MKIWRTVFDDSCRQAILRRRRGLKPDAHRRWGRVTAPQMIAHLTDQMHHSLGDCPVEARPGLLRWRVIRYASIYLVPWPKGRVRSPREAFVTQATSWEADVGGLGTLLERFAARGAGGDWPDHALFSGMTRRDWGVFIHKHFDQHLRQFGA